MGICHSCISRDYDFGRKDKTTVGSTPTLCKNIQKFDTLGRKVNGASFETENEGNVNFATNSAVARSLAKKISRASRVSETTCDTISNQSDRDLEGTVNLSFSRTSDSVRTPSTSQDDSTLGSLPDFQRRSHLESDVSEHKEYIFSRIGSRRVSVSRVTEDTESMGSDSSEGETLHWKKGNKLGSGSFGTVYLGLTDIGELIAVKQIDISSADFMEAEKEYDKIYREVMILKNLKHINIVQYLGATFEDNTISIFTEYVSGGSLSSIIQKFGPLTENITSRYTKQLLDAIAYMHENSLVHRDIKSANIMLMPEGVLKLIDFGCARKLVLRLSNTGSQLMKSLKGTPYWMAPEVINESGHGKRSDIWSLGCTVFEMLTGKPPWGDREPFAALYAIGSDDIPMPELPDFVSENPRQFVQLCLTRDKRRRPTAVKLKSHVFVHHIPETQTSYESQCTEEGKCQWVEKENRL